MIGLIRPDPSAAKRPQWRLVHRIVGVSIIAIFAPIALFTGCYAYGSVNVKKDSYKWFVSLCRVYMLIF